MNNLAENLANLTKLKSGVERLTLTDFRNYASLRLKTEIAPIVVYGENGSGKTNILEAISFLTPGRGLRGARLADIKRFIPQITGKNEYSFISPLNWAVAADVIKNDEIYTIATAVEKSAKDDCENEEFRSFERRIVKVDNTKLASQGDLGKYFSATWLTPQMDRLFRGGSQPRRSFLDRLVYAFDMEHAKRTATFEHLYRERFRLLKEGKNDNHWLDSIEENMATTGVAIAAARREQIARLNAFIENEPDDVFPSVRLELDGKIEKLLDNKPAVLVEDEYKNMLSKQRNFILDYENLEGVNRSDFKVYYRKKGMPADLCSTGEQKSLLVSIILAQTKCQTLHQGFAPVMLLDEVTAHLDDVKREALLEKISDLNIQAWITTTNPELFDSLRNDAQFLEVRNNTIISF
ncbi:MAG: DNA replication/repair protein RecF [Alphaproteobacteria bacterium]|nr:DNA replication/repair protein RecF [Alphaproteobacteria bacterium]